MSPMISKFVQYYLSDGMKNAAQAAIKAGYSERTARQKANTLLKRDDVRELIKVYQDELSDELKISREDIAKMYLESYKMAKIPGERSGQAQTAAMVAATGGLAKLLGHNAPEKQEVKNTISGLDILD